MCFDERKTPVNIITLMSILVVICCIIVAVFTYLGTQSETLDTIADADSMSDLSGYQTMFAIICFILAALILIQAIMGFLFRCCKSPCYACCYGILSGPVWIALIVIGGIAVALALAPDDMLKEECNKVVDETSSSSQPADDGSDDITFDLNIYAQLKIDTYMCAADGCLCASTANKASWTELKQEDIKDTYKSERDFSTNAFTMVQDEETEGKGFTDYLDCIKNVKDDANTSTEFFNFAKTFRESEDYDDIVEYLQFFEKEYDCAGICDPALFYFSVSVEKGVPSKSCLIGISDELKTSLLGIGGATLASGIFLFITFVFQYCLWRKYDED